MDAQRKALTSGNPAGRVSAAIETARLPTLPVSLRAQSANVFVSKLGLFDRSEMLIIILPGINHDHPQILIVPSPNSTQDNTNLR